MSGENGSKSQIDLDLTLCCANLFYQADIKTATLISVSHNCEPCHKHTHKCIEIPCNFCTALLTLQFVQIINQDIIMYAKKAIIIFHIS